MTLQDPRGPDAGLRELDWLLTPEDAATAFTRAGVRVDRAEPTYVRLKPGRGAIVGYQLGGSDPDGVPVTLPAYARTFTDDHVRIIVDKWGRSRAVATPLGPGFVLLEGGQTVLFVFPNDSQLRGLRKLDRIGSELEELLSEEFPVERETTTLTPVRYKPERRFIASTSVGLRSGDGPGRSAFFLRVFADSRAERLAKLAAAIRSDGGSSLVPRPFGTILRGRVFVEEQVEGEEYLAVVLAGGGDPGAVADALIRLHGCAPAFIEPIGPAALLDTLSGALEAASALDPGVATAAREVMDRLLGLLPPVHQSGLVHGDMALHNVLAAPGGPVIVDLERARMGDPLQDVGKVVAHLRDEGEQHPESRRRLREFEEELVDTYARASGDGALERLPFFTAAALADRAAGSVLRRALDHWWPSRPAELLELALEAIRGAKVSRPTFFAREAPTSSGAQWQVFYPKDGATWAGFLQDPSGQVVYGVYESSTDSFREVRPEEDAELPALARWIGDGDLLNYRVGRRATVRVPGRDGEPGAFVKIRPLAKAKVLRRYRAVHDLLASRPDAPRVPPLIEYRPEEGVIVLAELSGRSLRDFVLEGAGEVEGAIDVAARAVAQLHSIPGSELDAPRLRPPMQPSEYATLAARHAPDSAAAYRVAAQEVSEALQRAQTNGDRVLHGDLHDGNVLLDGDLPALLDLDLVHRGDPAEDVGNMMAHLLLRTLQRGGTVEEGGRTAQRFLTAYRRAGGTVESRPALAWGALSLFRLSCIYLFRRSWRTLTPTLRDESVRWARRSAFGRDIPPGQDLAEAIAVAQASTSPGQS